MINNNVIENTNKVLTFFAIIYTIITIYFICQIKRDQSETIVYFFLFLIFWSIAAIVLSLLFWFKIIKIETTLDQIALGLSTPGPLLGFFIIWSFLPSSQIPMSTYEFNNNGYRHKEVKYQYNNGQLMRKEYYISKDSVTDEKPLPENNIWIKDSIWTYFNSDGTIERKEKY